MIIAAYQTQLERQTQRPSVMPCLYFALMSNEQGVHVTVSNSGIGPALIDDVRVRLRGREIEMNPYDFFLSQRSGDGGGISLSVDRVLPGRLIPARYTVLMLGTDTAGGQHLFQSCCGSCRRRGAEVFRKRYDGSGSSWDTTVDRVMAMPIDRAHAGGPARGDGRNRPAYRASCRAVP